MGDILIKMVCQWILFFNVDEKFEQKQKLYEEDLKQLKCIYETGNKILDSRRKRYDVIWEELELCLQIEYKYGRC
jgi:hypothetical protein